MEDLIYGRDIDTSDVPIISFPDFMFQRLHDILPKLASKSWIVDVLSEVSVKFEDVQDQTKRVASALSRLGFGQNDVLYFVTYECATLHVILLAVWKLGGVVRGYYQQDPVDVYTEQMRESNVRFVLVDAETEPLLRNAVTNLEWSVTFLSVGLHPVKNTLHFSQLLQDDGSATLVPPQINPHTDALIITCTSGSSGMPKGAITTHFAAVSFFHSVRGKLELPISQMSLSGTFSVSHFFCAMSTLFSGSTMHFVSKFRRENFLDHLLKYKPMHVTMYPYVACWFVRNMEDFSCVSFIKVIALGGSVIDPATIQLLRQKLPHVVIVQIYACTECMGIAYGEQPIIKTMHGEVCVASGSLLPYVQAKIIDAETGRTVERGGRGEILVRAPYVMKGYVTPDQSEPDRSTIDSDGWYHTGDIGFFDDDNTLFVRERASFVFKYYMHFVMPREIEAVILELPTVQSVSVVGIPNLETTSAAWAFVVPRGKASAQEIIDHVSSRLPFEKRLHGGVHFLNVLPMNRGGKTDRLKLMQLVNKSA